MKTVTINNTFKKLEALAELVNISGTESFKVSKRDCGDWVAIEFYNEKDLFFGFVIERVLEIFKPLEKKYKEGLYYELSTHDVGKWNETTEKYDWKKRPSILINLRKDIKK